MPHACYTGFLIAPPEDEPIFRFGATLIADAALAWFDGQHLVWLHRAAQRCISLHQLSGVRATVSFQFGHAVRQLELLAGTLERAYPTAPAIIIQDRFGGVMQHTEPDFPAFATAFIARLRRLRPLLSIEGDEAVLFS